MTHVSLSDILVDAGKHVHFAWPLMTSVRSCVRLASVNLSYPRGLRALGMMTAV
jgi:hypothetical protein